MKKPIIHKKGASFCGDIFTLCGRVCVERFYDRNESYLQERLRATDDDSLVTCRVCRRVLAKAETERKS